MLRWGLGVQVAVIDGDRGYLHHSWTTLGLRVGVGIVTGVQVTHQSRRRGTGKSRTIDEPTCTCTCQVPTCDTRARYPRVTRAIDISAWTCRTDLRTYKRAVGAHARAKRYRQFAKVSDTLSQRVWLWVVSVDSANIVLLRRPCLRLRRPHACSIADKGVSKKERKKKKERLTNWTPASGLACPSRLRAAGTV